MGRADKQDDIDDLTTTDFFARAKWATTGEPFDPVAFARAQLQDAIAALEHAPTRSPHLGAALHHAREALRELEAEAV
jgi:hypothetical protein